MNVGRIWQDAAKLVESNGVPTEEDDDSINFVVDDASATSAEGVENDNKTKTVVPDDEKQVPDEEKQFGGKAENTNWHPTDAYNLGGGCNNDVWPATSVKSDDNHTLEEKNGYESWTQVDGAYEDNDLDSTFISCYENEDSMDVDASIEIDDKPYTEKTLTVSSGCINETKPTGGGNIHHHGKISGKEASAAVTVTEPMDLDVNIDDDSFTFSDDDSDDEMLVVHKTGVDLNLLATILERGKTATADIGNEAEVVIVLGATGVGKSTFIQSIAGHRIHRGFDESLHKTAYLVEGDGEEGFEIGHGMKSQTRHVRSYYCESSSTFYIDSSGFGDSQSIETDIATSICVKDIASRASKLRFVVLINAYTFFIHRTHELKKNLDLVAKFVGHNFEDHRKCFTFLFTHCNRAFENIVCGEGCDHERVMVAMRSELSHLLSETKKATQDPSIKSLISFLRASLDKKYPFCDVFDPMLSNIKSIRDGINPRNRNYSISSPQSHVRCSLTPTSRLLLQQELKSRLCHIDGYLSSNGWDEGLKADANAICSLAGHIQENFCLESAQSMISLLKSSFDHNKNQLVQHLNTGLLETAPLENHAEMAKVCMGRISEIGKVLQDCWSLSGVANTELSGDDTLRQVVCFLEIFADGISDIFSTIEPFVSSVDESLDKPDLRSAVSKLKKLKEWCFTFGGDFAAFYEKVAKSISACIMHVVSSLPPSGNATFADGPKTLRILTTFNALLSSEIHDALSPYYDSRTELENVLPNALHQAMNVLKSIPDVVQKEVNTAFDHMETVQTCVAVGERVDMTIFVDLSSVLSKVETMNGAILQEGYLRNKFGSYHPRKAALKVILVEFASRYKLCSRLIAQLNADIGRLLEYCFRSLRQFIDSMPSQMRSIGQFDQYFRQLILKLRLRLLDDTTTLKAFASHLESRGFTGDPTVQRQLLCTLYACQWSDSVMSDLDSQEPGVVHTTLLQVEGFYTDYCTNHAQSINQCISDVLQMGESGVEDQLLTISASFQQMREIAIVVTRELEQLDGCLLNLRKCVKEWSKFQLESDIAASIDYVDSNMISKLLQICESLQSIDNEVAVHTEEVASLVRHKLELLCNDVDSILSAEANFLNKCSLLERAREWSKHSQLRNFLPLYDELCGRLNKQTVQYAKCLHDKIISADADSDLNEMERSMEELRSAAPSLDSHIDFEATNWTNIILVALENRRSVLDDRFAGFIDENKFEKIAIYISALKEESGSTDRLRTCLKALSVHLWPFVVDIRSAIASSTVPSSGARKLNNKLKILRCADSSLSPIVPDYPPPFSGGVEWTLGESVLFLQQELEASLKKVLQDAIKAIRSVDFIESIACRSKSDFIFHVIGEPILEQVAKSIRDKVGEFLQLPEGNVHDFLAALEQPSEPSTLGRRWERAERRPNFPPDTKCLRKILRRLKDANNTHECPRELVLCYTESKEKLSIGLNELYETLHKEAEDGYFSRPLEVLSFLKTELDMKGMREHVDISFDLAATLTELTEQKLQQLRSTRSDLLDKEKVNSVAKQLDYLSYWETVSFFKFWRKKDYDETRRSVSYSVQEFVVESCRQINDNDFGDLLNVFVAAERVQAKLSRHLLTKENVCDALGTAFSERLSRLHSDTQSALVNGNSNQFQLQLKTLIKLSEEMSCNAMTSGSHFLTRMMDSLHVCQSNIHIMISMEINKILQELNERMKKQDYEAALRLITLLQDFGFALVTTFELYQHDIIGGESVNNIGELSTLVQVHFARGLILDIGRSLAMLDLPPTVTYCKNPRNTDSFI